MKYGAIPSGPATDLFFEKRFLTDVHQIKTRKAQYIDQNVANAVAREQNAHRQNKRKRKQITSIIWTVSFIFIIYNVRPEIFHVNRYAFFYWFYVYTKTIDHFSMKQLAVVGKVFIVKGVSVYFPFMPGVIFFFNIQVILEENQIAKRESFD